MNYRQIKAIELANKQKIIATFGDVPNTSGIYILTREESGFKFAYVGQAKHILNRLAQHLTGYQHIDLSLKKHGLKTEKNPTGYELKCIECDCAELDEQEQFYIKKYANDGYQLRNKTVGGQGVGKVEIAETKPKKTYREGLAQGYVNAQNDVKKLFFKNLFFEINGKKTKNKEKSYEKFKNFLEESKKNEGR